ncbi:hypothetical protein FHR32_008724 [Streptosporangium album]|uniref:Uncharacterized protein n=1 Tax=Streptosporangium album TaxID=47479 RepID=A0A7W7S6U0_9ACTN|nr:hypothetical protein [Streptosporangium album]MBB4944318.1 hypothetical protein [Streptosporangium album]
MSYHGPDAAAVEAAAQVQALAPTWLVRWSSYWQRLEAWECSDPNRCVVVQGRSAAELWQHMVLARPETLPPLAATSPPAPTPADHRPPQMALARAPRFHSPYRPGAGARPARTRRPQWRQP